MKTPIEVQDNSRLIALYLIKKLERMGVNYNEDPDNSRIIADIEPSRAWNCGIIYSGSGFGNYKPILK